MSSSLVDLIALGGKLSVEASSLDRLSKEGMKTGIDHVADMIKSIQLSQQNAFSVMGLSLSNIRTVKIAAETYGLTQVTLFPCPVNNAVIPCLKMEGGDAPAFCKALGLPIFEQANINANELEQESLIEQYGVVVYLRKAKS